jgi:serine/threonine-protein kinase
MEYLDGVDLSTWLKQRGPLPIELAVDFVLQACEAVADAHVLGIVHRDLKPANLFCVRRSDGQLSIKVLDFGISKVTTPGAPGHNMTGTSALVGSPFYMSPEQMQLSKSVDARTDIWALGIILFELVTGRPPFESEAVTDLAIKVATEPTPPARAFRPEVPPGLEQVIGTCLAKDRNQRFPSISELAIALKDFGSKQAKVSVERVLGTLRQAGISGASLPRSGEFPSTAQSTPALPRAAETGASWGQTGGARPTSAGRAVPWIAAAVVLGVLVVAGVLLVRGGPHPTAAGASVVAAPPPPVAAAAPAVLASSAAASSTAPPGGSSPPVIQVSDLPTATAKPVVAYTGAAMVPAVRPDASTVPPVSAPAAPARPVDRSTDGF